MTKQMSRLFRSSNGVFWVEYPVKQLRTDHGGYFTPQFEPSIRCVHLYEFRIVQKVSKIATEVAFILTDKAKLVKNYLPKKVVLETSLAINPCDQIIGVSADSQYLILRENRYITEIYNPCQRCIYCTGVECLPCTVNPSGYGEICKDYLPVQ